MLAVLCALSAHAAMAQESVLFRPYEGHERAALVDGYFNRENIPFSAADTRIAEADLNRDGLPELLVQLSGGDVHLLAIPPRRPPLALGVIELPNALQIAETSDFGVRRLIASGTPLNDYARRTYGWDPQAARYRPLP